jgi:hypothetical protein
MSREEMTSEEQALLNNLYIPTFAEKMAELGRPVGDADTLEHALELTARVKEAVQQEGTNTIKSANLALRKATGADIQEAAQNREKQVKTAARQVASNPAFRKLLGAFSS